MSEGFGFLGAQDAFNRVSGVVACSMVEGRRALGHGVWL